LSFEEARQRKIEAGHADDYELLFLGHIALKRGHLQNARDLYRRSFEKADVAGHHQTRTLAQLAQAELAFQEGDPANARRLAELALQTAEINGMADEATAARNLLQQADRLLQEVPADH
jgi:hypothetical protein